MSIPKITVILAVYRAEAYIEQCARSLFNQTLDNLEYIFIDDHSPDKSIEIMERILEEYPNRKSQVKVIRHTSNQGVGKTRQDGIDSATGEYIIHCDPDDWIDEDLYEKLYHKAKKENADIVLFDFMYESDISKQYPQKPLEYTSESILGSIVGTNRHWLHCSLCNKLIKRSCYESTIIPKGFDSHEDSFVLINILSKKRTIEYVPKAYYHYRINNQASLTKGFNKENMENDRNAVTTIMALDNIEDDVKNAFATKVLARDVLSKCYSNKEFKKHYYDYRNLISSNLQEGSRFHKFFLYISCIGFHSVFLNYLQIRRVLSKFKRILIGIK